MIYFAGANFESVGYDCNVILQEIG